MKKILLLLLSASIFIEPMQAQSGSVSGTIVDAADGSPLSGASINLSGTSRGTLSDPSGGFSIIVPSQGAKLTITLVGYQSREVETKPGERITVRMESDRKALNEVVVTGVAQATSKRKLSFSLTSVKGSDINIVPQLDASQSLRGRVAGIQISQNQGDGGAAVFLRGAKSVFGNIAPLVVVDGFQTNLSLSDLNPEDIEAIEVVKGAAAASLYGTRAEGGVIQVVTKKGKGAKNKPTIVVDGEYGINNIQRTPALTQYHHYAVNADGSFVLNGNTRSTAYESNGFSLKLSPYQQYYDNTSALLDNRPFHNISASISNASGPFSYYFSFQNQTRGGAVTVIDPDVRNTLKLNLGYKPFANVETNLTVQHIDFNNPGGFISRNNQGTLFAATLQYEPFINLKEKGADGNYLAEPTGFKIQNANLYNPLYEWSQREIENKTTKTLLGGDLKWKFLGLFELFISGSINRDQNNSKNYYPIGYKTVTPNSVLNQGFYGVSYTNNYFKNGNIQLSFNNKYKDLDIGASVKMIYEETGFDANGGSGYRLTAPVKDLGVTDPTTRSFSTNWAKTINIGYFANLRFGWKDKFFLDLLGRVDQSSRYGKEVESAFFPRAAAAYRLTQDINLGKINELKFRAAWGRAGSLPPYNAKSSIASITATGISINQLENTALERSYTDELEIGVDGQAFNRINFNLTYANARSYGDFVSPPSFIPLYGSSSIVRNLGNVKSNSYEAEINGDVIRSKNFTWNIGFTFTRIRSQITDLNGIPDFTTSIVENGFTTANLFRKAPGYSAYAFWGYKVLRSLDELQVDKNGNVINAGNGTLKPGDFAINSMGFVVEKSKMGTINERPVYYTNAKTGNTTFLGRGEPDFQIGIPTTFTLYENLSIFFLLDWKKGGLKYNQTTQYLTFDNRTRVYEDFARAGLPLQFVQSIYNGNSITDYWLEDNSFLAFREFSMAYRIPRSKLGKLGKIVSGMRMAIIGRNLFYFTNYRGVNPEGYYEYYPYPVYRTISAKITLNLF